MERRLLRVGGKFVEARKTEKEKPAHSVRRITTDSGIPLFDRIIKAVMPNPDKLRARLAKTGHRISLGEYLLINLVLIRLSASSFSAFAVGWARMPSALLGIAVGLYIPHIVTGFMGARRASQISRQFPRSDRHHVPRVAFRLAGDRINRRRRTRNA